VSVAFLAVQAAVDAEVDDVALDEHRTYLALAALAYRGFADVGPEAARRAHIAALIRHGLEEVPVLRGRWSWAYGPVTYRSPFALLDDAMLYAVESRQAPHRIAIVLRGTNPIAAADWAFGDFLVGMAVPWPYGEPADPAGGGAKVSLSTALGLAIVRQMRAEALPSEPLGRIWAALGEADAGAELSTREAMGSLVAWAESFPSAARLCSLYQRFAGERHERASQSHPEQIRSIRASWASELRDELFEHVATALRDLDDHCSPALLPLVEGAATLAAHPGPGVDLRSFLAAFVEQAGGAPVDVVVTGHSKAGALAQAVALWLSDTQTADTTAERAWDPRRLATVRCFSFAGPTAGDAGFAARATRVLGGGLHRIVNPLDVVPCTWSMADLTRIARLYTAPVEPLAGLSELVTQVSGTVQPLDYQHAPARETRTLAATLDPACPAFLHQMMAQHLDGYLRALDLDIAVFE
jgi:hypothetical protein